MDPVSAVGAGWNIGTISGAAILKYDRGIYEERLTELKSIKKELDQHLETLKSIKGELPGFWDDKLGNSLSATTQQWINNVEEGSEKLQSMISTTEDLIAELEKSLNSGAETLQEVNAAASAVSGTISGAGAIK